MEKTGKRMVSTGFVILLTPIILLLIGGVINGPANDYQTVNGSVESTNQLGALSMVIFFALPFAWPIILILLLISLGLIVNGVFLIASSKNPNNPDNQKI